MSDASDSTPVYKDASFPIEERISDLLARMTLDEKVAQLGSVELYENMAYAEEKTKERIKNGIGQLTRVAGSSNLRPVEVAELTNSIQKHLIENTRLGIPAMVHEECCSGYMAAGATCFPQIIGAASAWSPELIEQMTSVIRKQMKAAGAHQGLSPVLDVARDPRWGRTEETFGEDPYLISRMGVSYVKGLQGPDLKDGIVATGKHFVGYSMPEGGLNWAPAKIMPRELRDVFLMPFEAAVKEAGLASMMNAYHELDGVPCGCSEELLTEILRNEWSFKGIVVSDYHTVRTLAQYHRVAKDRTEAAAMALKAGIDVELPHTDCYGGPLHEAVRKGMVTEELTDKVVTRILKMKFELGLFENPYVPTDTVEQIFETSDQRALARELAQKSMVLLKNSDALLPLKKDVSSIAVIGPNADNIRSMVGDYSHASQASLAMALQGGGDMPDDSTGGLV
jgi:beta-glucosidase